MTFSVKQVFAVVLAFVLCATAVRAADGSAASTQGHAFDFLLGTWRTHIAYLQTLPGGKTTWVKITGTVVNRALWDGSGDLEEIDAGGATNRFQGLTLRLYDEQSGQWKLYWANSSDGMLEQPQIGMFRNGAGDFYDQETIGQSAAFVHQRYLPTSPNSYRFEESISRDGGRTWKTDFTASLTRISHAAIPVADSPVPAAPVAQHAFDWQFGTWKIRMSRLLHPLSGSTARDRLVGTVDVQKIWNGRANYALIDAGGRSGDVHILALRLYLPQSRQWSLSFTTRGSADLSVPMYGTFKDGRGEFYDQEFYKGRAILDRFVFYDIGSGRARDEEAFSDDGGKTWETTWINTHERVSAQASI